MTVTINGTGTGCFTDASGNVGIGTSTPTARLQSTTASVAQNFRFDGNDFAGGNYYGSSVNTTGVFTGLDSAGNFAVNVRDAGAIAFSTTNTERFRIGSAGQFGIGGATYGTSGQVLTSGGSGAAPSWAASSSITLGTKTATTSGTIVDYTGIPSTAERINILFAGVSLSGTADLYVQIGTSGGIVSSGYASAWSTNNSNGTFTAAFGIRVGAGTIALSGSMVISLMGSNQWSAYGVNSTATAVTIMGGNLTLGGTLDRVRITSSNGTDTFDAGSVNISVES